MIKIFPTSSDSLLYYENQLPVETEEGLEQQRNIAH